MVRQLDISTIFHLCYATYFVHTALQVTVEIGLISTEFPASSLTQA